ncbi:MAG: (2Fe-2S) ferredoxin domain-containing protein [Candidatus Rokubacteria bacterium]|nr:(2Fe-2S) ferredoxin domain-containing protein [Candidatus Rokubacteria bacterium]
MADDGLLFVCVGCCCGRNGHGGALAPAGRLKSAARRAFDAAGLSGRVRMAFTECLGPCSESNVVFLYLRGRAVWLRRVNTPDLFGEVLRYADEATRNRECALSPRLRAHSFSWTGGGIGPKPPVPDGTSS